MLFSRGDFGMKTENSNLPYMTKYFWDLVLKVKMEMKEEAKK